MSALELQKVPLRQVSDVRQLLMNDQARGQLAAVAAKHMNPERMMRVVANAIRSTPKLQQCEPMSFLGALMQCASLGLEPNTILGHAYLIPFDKSKKITHDNGRVEWVKIPEVQLVIGYKGLIDLARRSGHITSLNANIHYSDDELWDYEEGTEARLRHKPGAEAGTKLHSYAVAKFTDGGHAYVVLPWSRVMKIRDGAQAYQNAKKLGKLEETPWVKYEDEMAKKTAIRALAKYLPLSVEFRDAMEIDEVSADYRAFAMDPTAGVIPDEDQSETIDAEPVEQKQVDAPKEEKAKPKPRAEAKKPEPEQPKETQKAEPKTEAPKDPPVARREQAAETKPEDQAKTDPEPEAETEEDPVGDLFSADDKTTAAAETDETSDPLDSAFARQVIEDAEGFGAAAALATHGAQIEGMRATDPVFVEALLAELARIGG